MKACYSIFNSQQRQRERGAAGIRKREGVHPRANREKPPQRCLPLALGKRHRRR